MQNRYFVSPERFTQIRQLPGPVVEQDYDVPNCNYDLWSHAGFGPTAKVNGKYSAISAGQYDGQRYKVARGKVTYTSRRTGTDNIEGIMTQEGSLSPIGAATRLSYGNYPVEYDTEVYNRALEKLYDGIKVTESNLALTLGEFRESGRMLGLGKSVYGLLTTARTVKRQFLRNPSKTLSELWLSYKLGWSPFVQDIYNYLNWNYKSFDEGLPIVGRSRRQDNVVDRTGNVQTWPGFGTVSGTRQWKAEVKVWAGIASNSLYNSTRITSLNPLSIVWELTPLSFVVDWLFNVGQYLQLMESALGAGLTFKKGYATQVYFHDLSDVYLIDALDSSGGWDYITQGNWESKWRHGRKVRQELFGFPFPELPTFKTKLGSSQIITATALLRVILLGKVQNSRW